MRRTSWCFSSCWRRGVPTLALLRGSSDGCGRDLPSKRSICSPTPGSRISWAGSSTTRTRSASGRRRGRSSTSVLGQARRDLRTLREMFALDAAVLLGRVESAVPALAGIWVPWTSPEPGGGLSAAHGRAQALGGGGLGGVRGASCRPLRQAWSRTLRPPQGIPLERRETPGRLPSRPREPRRTRRLRARAGAFDQEHRAFSRRAAGPPRTPVRPAGDGQVLHRQGYHERVRGEGCGWSR